VAAAKLRPTGPLADLLGRSLGPLLTELTAGEPSELHRSSGEPVVVTWAPTVSSRARRRGGDQAEALARAAAQETSSFVRVVPTLRRIGRGRQVGRDRVQRIDGVRFVAQPGSVPAGARVVVVDDVCTTGATLHAAGAALLDAGAARVDGLVLAVRS
jgi:predicted amidophosphoribosyltransferase